MIGYQSYKPSGIAWISRIPSHWDIVDTKKCFRFPKEIVGSKVNEFQVLSLSINGVIFRDMSSGAGKQHSDMSTYQIVRPDSIVLCLFDMDVTPRIVGHSDKIGIITSAYVNIHPKNEICSKYYYYYFLLQDFNKYLFSQGTGIRTTLTRSQFGALKIGAPPLPEQTAIARFLDYKVGKIDRFIRKKKQLIKLLTEQKAAIINNAVTKGLDPTVLMKDSGIEWLGEIPAQWEVRKLKYLGKFQNGISAAGDYFGSGFPFVSYGDVYKNFELPKTGSGLANSSEADQMHYSVLKGDVFFTRTSETVEEIGFTSTCMESIANATFSGFLIRFRPKAGWLFDGFSRFYFRSSLHRRFFVKEMNLVTRASLSQDLLKSLPVLLPPLDEQERISKFIDRETEIINATITTIQKEIALTEEYRTALIAEAVTGKIDVRGYEVRDEGRETWGEAYALEDEEDGEMLMAAEDDEEYGE